MCVAKAQADKGVSDTGSWVLSDGPEMAWTHGDLWRADVALPAGGVYEYKYVLVGSGAGGRHALAWQRGNNSVLALSANESEAEVWGSLQIAMEAPRRCACFLLARLTGA